MKRIKSKLFYLVFFAIITAFFSGCKEDELLPGKPNEHAKELGISYTGVNLDATSDEVVKFYYENKDSVTFYGKKNEDGITESFNSMMLKRDNGDFAVLQFNDEKKLSSIYASNGVSIDFNWIEEKTCVVKIYNPEDNTYYSTVWYPDSIPPSFSQNEVRSTRNSYVPRDQKLELTIDDLDEIDANALRKKANSVDSYPDYQDIQFAIHQCNVGVNAFNTIALFSAKDGKYINTLNYLSQNGPGVYNYKLPIHSYPSKATNKEILNNIDNALNWASLPLGYLVAMESGLAVWLNYFAVVTLGGAALPAAVIDCILIATTTAKCGIDIISYAGGFSHIVESLNPDLYYKEYIVDNIKMVTHTYHNGEYYEGEPFYIKPETGQVLLSQEIPGEMTIDSFTLTPDFPHEYEPYVAEANFHCVPPGSTIRISVVGTDGYTDSISQTTTSTKGHFSLRVPGSYGGVRDVCTVEIVSPDNDILVTTAVLLFTSFY